MNRIELPKAQISKRRRREAPAQLELTLPLHAPRGLGVPRGHEPESEPQPEAEEPRSDRGTAVVDFYI